MKEIELFVPGRLCLFGEHSDWAGAYRTIDPSISVGHCIAVGTNQGISATVRPHSDKLMIISKLPSGKVLGPEVIEMDESNLLRTAKEGGFFSYCAGVAYYFQTRYKVGGLIIRTSMDLSIKRGLSSSAAICVLVARAFNQIYKLGLTTRDEMEYAYLGEILTGSECGRMDQVCAYGQIPVFLTFDGDDMHVDELTPPCSIPMIVVDLKAGKNTRKILSDLNAYFFSTDGKVGENVRYALGSKNREILLKARESINAGVPERIGMLMREAQDVFDKFVTPACPEELTSPKLHQVLSFPKIQHLVWGGKGVGSQGDGSAQFVAKGEQERDEVIEILKKLDVECFKLDIKNLK